jgi:hypothetical protein
MTDIRQHLPAILRSIRQHLAQAETPEALGASLRTLLPTSYGLGVGQLVNEQGQLSPPLDVIIYDTTIDPAQIPDRSSCYDLHQALAVILLAQELQTDALRAFLHTIASVKLLRFTPQQEQAQMVNARSRPGQASRKPSLKKLLPLGIVASQRLLDVPSDEPEELALCLDALLKEQPEHLRPDYLLTQAVTYRNPLLDGGAFVSSTVNIVREPMLPRPRPCYVCKLPSSHAHFFYHSLCLRCGDLNYQKRSLPADLTGRIALVTGARVKIGYATALRTTHDSNNRGN